MSIKLMSAIWDASKLKGTPLLLMLALADYANEQRVCWPGVAALAQRVRIKERQVQYLLRSLEKAGYLSIDVSGGPHGSNLYTLTDPQSLMAALAPELEPWSTGREAVQENAPVQDDNAGGAGTCTGGVHCPAPKPSLNHHRKPPTIGASAPEPSKPARKPPKEPDPRSDSVAIQCARGVGGRYPPKEIYDDVIRILGESPDGEKLAACRKTWVGRGYNPNSWNWLLEWYASGITPLGRNGNGASPDPPPKPKASGPVVIVNPQTGKREVIGGNGNTAGRESTSAG